MKRLNEMEQLVQPIGSLYDFIYIDIHKSKILLAQIESDGILTHIKSRTEQQNLSINKAGIDTGLVLGKENNNTDIESIEQSFDAALSVHLKLLHKLSEQNRIKKDITNAKVGDIVLFSGAVDIFDISTLQGLLSSGLIPISKKDKDFNVVTAVIKLIPSTVQFTFKDEKENRAWMTLPENNLLMPSSELLLKYGGSLEGEWSIIGILDSLPGKRESAFADNRENISKLSLMSNKLHELAGKHPDHFGITPLMIFRSIANVNTQTE